MSKGRHKEEVKAADNPVPSLISVHGASWDPADPALNNNSDQPVYVSPISMVRSFNPLMGQPIHEGGGESRPMFTSSLKEY